MTHVPWQCVNTRMLTPTGVEGVSVGDRVGYITRSQLGGSYADFTVVQDRLVTRLPDDISTQQAAAVLLQGLTALSQATVAVSNEIQPGACAAQQQGFGIIAAGVQAPLGHDWTSNRGTPQRAHRVCYTDC